MTISKLVEVLDQLYPQYRVVENTKEYSVTIYIGSDILTQHAIWLEEVRAAGIFFRVKEMTFWQKLIFGDKSVGRK